MASAAGAGAGPGAPPLSHSEADALLSRINSALDGKRNDEARALLARLQLPVSDGRRRSIEAALCIREGKYEEGLGHALYAISLQDGHWSAYPLAARAYIAFGRMDKAQQIIEALNAAHDTDGKKVRLAFFQRQCADLTNLIRQIEEKSKAATGVAGKYQLRELFAVAPHSEALTVAEFGNLIADSLYASVIAKAIELHPMVRQHPDIRAHVGTAYMYTGRMADARAEFEASATHSKRSKWYADLFAAMDQSRVAIGGFLATRQYTDANAACIEALRLDLKAAEFNSEVKCLMSKALLGMGQADAALRKACEAHATNPKNIKALHMQAQIHLEENRYNDCISVLDAIQRIDPDDPVAKKLRQDADLHYDLTHSTHYEVLGVDSKASAEDIKRAWQTRVKLHHPDRAPPDAKDAATKLTARCNAAYNELMDPVLRDEYDRVHSVEMSVADFLGVAPVRQSSVFAPPPPTEAPAAAAAAAAAAAVDDLSTSDIPMLDAATDTAPLDPLADLNAYVQS